MTRDPARRLTCPSARADEGAALIGIVSETGRIDLLDPPLVATREFIQEARRGRPLEQRFRFASPCLERGCDKWKGDGCGVGRVLAALDPGTVGLPPAVLPACATRAHCRWYTEHGPAICHTCTFVITEREKTNPEE